MNQYFQVATRTATSSKQKPIQKPAVEATGGWSNDGNNGDDQEYVASDMNNPASNSF